MQRIKSWTELSNKVGFAEILKVVLVMTCSILAGMCLASVVMLVK